MFAQEISVKVRTDKSVGKDLVNAVGKTRRCYNCDNFGHLADEFDK